MIGLGAI